MSFQIDRRRLPPLNALIAFEAAARLGSFVEAGEEVHLTASAISRQVKALEEHLGVALFDRVRQRVHLTEAGRFLATQVRESLSRLLTVSEQAAQLRDARRTLNVGVLTAFANRWLIRRLPDFVERHPDITLNLVTFGTDFNYDDSDLDCAVHTNSKAWADTVAYQVGDEEIIAVASPAWIARHGVRRPADLAQLILLNHPHRPLWSQWFQQNGVELPAVPREFRMGQYSMVFEGALSSLGAALVPRMLAQDDIVAGRLQEIPGRSVAMTAGYFLVHPLARGSYSPLRDFRDWLLEAAGVEPVDPPA